MNKQKFLTDLDLALHWYLPQPEADEILADYQEMAASAEDDCPLLRENPKAIAQSLLVILCICGLISIVVCIYSLVQCRLRSCRWLTVYGLALTLILGLVMVLTILTNMSFSSDINLLQRLIWELIYIGEVMLAGCALSLANWF